MSTRWTRDEITGILASRKAREAPEGQGDGGVLTFTIKVTPEYLDAMLSGTWTNTDGSTVRFEGVYVDDEGYAEPILTRVAPKT